MKGQNREVLIKFTQTSNPRELDEMIYNLEKDLKKQQYDYFLKESENPYIYFIEYPKADQLIKQIQYNTHIIDIKPVKCVINNINHITATILKKIRYKLSYNDTFNVTCLVDSYFDESKPALEDEITNNIKTIAHINPADTNPTWNITIHLIGEVCAINIKRSNKNRNKYSQFT